MKSFESWTYEDVEETFNLTSVKNSDILKKWLSSKINITENHKIIIDDLKDLLSNNFISWNEDELKMQFIAPLISMIKFATLNYKPFSQRILTLKTEKIEISGIVDFMIAHGKARPKVPYFFLHEYKQQHPSKKNDPFGQLLISMVAAQIKNKNNNPIYGVVVEGRFWYFLILEKNNYHQSKAFDACEDDIYQIYAILCKVKDYIDEFIGIRN